MNADISSLSLEGALGTWGGESDISRNCLCLVELRVQAPLSSDAAGSNV